MVLCCNRVALDLSRTYRHTTPTGFRDPSPERTRRRFQLLVPWLQHDVTLWSSNRYSCKYRAAASPGRAERVPSPSAISYQPSAISESKLILRFSVGSDRNSRKISSSKDWRRPGRVDLREKMWPICSAAQSASSAKARWYLQ